MNVIGMGNFLEQIVTDATRGSDSEHGNEQPATKLSGEPMAKPSLRNTPAGKGPTDGVDGSERPKDSVRLNGAPVRQHDVRARILRRESVDGGVRIMMGAGRDQGISPGDKGRLDLPRGPQTFRVGDCTENSCVAILNISHDDIVQHQKYVVLNTP